MQLSFDSHKDSSQDMEVRHEVLLDIDELKKWGRWKSRSKAYLAGFSESINLLELVSEYRNTVEEFHAWFWDFLHEYHAKDIAELQAMDTSVRGTHL